MRGEAFTYGAGADAVVLSATVPVTSCVGCGEAYTGEEGEILRHEAVCVHLGRLTPAQITTIRGARTAEQLAEAGGFDLDAVRRWERGNRIQDAASDLVLRGLGEAA
jgi:DNA-binding transcriptional regulator YiaG